VPTVSAHFCSLLLLLFNSLTKAGTVLIFIRATDHEWLLKWDCNSSCSAASTAKAHVSFERRLATGDQQTELAFRICGPLVIILINQCNKASCKYETNLKTGLNEFPLFKTKRIKGYSYASVILENIKKNICARLIDDFDDEKYCNRNCREPNWQCRKSAVTSLGRYSWLSAVVSSHT